jgi:4-aminobutyrate aminotransferase-like enzyme/Ser/Thr protein kinase RdoA (MazF antagonist)
MSVLEAPPPRFTADEVATIAAALFGVEGAATNLGSERDQTFLIDDGGAGGVLKISNLGEEPAVLELEGEALLHVRRVDPELPVPEPRLSLGDEYWPTWDGEDGPHFVRLFERLHGRHCGPDLDDRSLYAYGQTHARLNLALRSYFHPAAGRKLLWDVAHAPDLREHVDAIPDPARRRLVETVLDRFDERVAPHWPLLRAQIVHGDLNLDNVLFDDDGRISGITDFGDIAFTAQAADFAIALASLLRGRPADDVFRAGRIATDGYQSRTPLEPLELELLGDLVAARLAAIVTISAWRVERYPENAEYIQNWDADSWALLEQFDALGYDEVARELGATAPTVPTPELARRRSAVLGPALTNLTYDDPVHVVRGEGVWLYSSDGRRLLDAYNNVPVVGHCHPRVTEAVVRQTRLLNTHARYLYEPLIELAERLVSLMPAGSGLDTVMLVNSGSEASELAWRFATAATGAEGAIVTEHAYHGVTTKIADLSPEEWPTGYDPKNVARIAPPREGVSLRAEMHSALDRLDGRLAATFVDGAFTSDGIWFPPAEQFAALVEETKAAGGLFVADEVQAGHGRTGDSLWCFERYGVTPDVVTLGKPMGNGYPVAAVITRREIADELAKQTSVFSTFGGNPVAAQAALAVLDVIADERLVENAARVGERLIGSLPGNVRGRGLVVGVELETLEEAERVVNRVREHGILIGRTGRDDNVLKIRPPLVFADEHADEIQRALERA